MRAALLLVLTVAAVLLGACAPPETGDDPEQRVADLEAQLTEAEQVIAELEQRLVEAEEGAPAPGVTPDPDARPDRAAIRSEDGLTQQLHAEGDWGMPDGDAGATDWQEDGFDIPEGFGEEDASGYATPGELLVDLVSAWGFDTELGGDSWEVTVRVLADGPEGAGLTDAETATGAVLLWGFLDDAVAGEDRRVDLRQGDDGWYVAGGAARFHCARGVSDDVCA